MVGKLVLALLAVALTPLVGGLLAGVDRRLTAWLQSRYGPPVLQPFYDVLKLLGKTKMVVNPWQALSASVYLAAAVTSVFIFFMQGDLLLIFFVLTIGAVFLVVGALSAPSPYSQIGGQRELWQMLAYEPLLILVFVSMAMVTGSFRITAILEHPTPLLYDLPLMFIVLGYVLTIKLRKSPFDISASQHAHQEIVRGVLTEYSGPHLALLEIAHWFEVVLVLGICSLFFATSALGVVVLLAATYFLEILIDNVMARMTWRWMLRSVLTVGLVLSLVNILWLYVA
ncbi:NADH-quinone oxidoreductase subunit H [Desulfovibrio sulfodismutans]|uniref:NADH-quinone oxidoreductase subunit H n=1 Tax=Desulfolutivibrio sulfodismutans TaxID=63561 RepID=A0A7K3NHT4_9BACT|nr:complex I subunit 1 family protein [Desulfolutivibrio sulfodismutans]NDY55756.1 NADH-quinone oxidoreductase subunit H [Desulfolutivibrio sulfodismutans]QLA13375.1 NADH-quinone oxidoreductase subunit H [Desulfolutivibrio sulfodismutans DSM 3696]